MDSLLIRSPNLYNDMPWRFHGKADQTSVLLAINNSLVAVILKKLTLGLLMPDDDL